MNRSARNLRPWLVVHSLRRICASAYVLRRASVCRLSASFMAALMAGVCAGSNVWAQAPGWTMRSNSGPPARYNDALAFDSARGQSVLFGGFGPNPPDDHFGDTWEWDGVGWALKSVRGPGERYGPGVVYDSVRALTVLYGGHMHHFGQMGDTWEWDGTSWTLRTESGPTPRDNHAMAYDSIRGRTVLFGGYDEGGLFRDDTWEWDGTSWVQKGIGGTAPSGRWTHAMCFDSARGRVVMFGGSTGSVELGDTWEWDGTSWTLRATGGPPPRSGPGIAYDAGTHRTVMLGGAAAPDTWEWDGTVWTRRSVSGPSQRFGPVMAYDSVRDRVVLFGGTFGVYFGDTWEYRGVRLGDMNLDGKVDGGDIAPFVSALLSNPSNATNVYVADFGGNGVVDFSDVNGFAAALLSAGS
jgi:hypothetical protein